MTKEVKLLEAKLFRPYHVDSAGKPLDRKARKGARRSTYDYNRGVSKLLREKRKEAKEALEKVAETKVDA